MSDSQLLNPIFEEFEPRSEGIIQKFKYQERSKRNLKRLISELQDDWESSVLFLQSAGNGLQTRSGGAGPGAGLNLDVTVPVPTVADSDFDGELNQNDDFKSESEAVERLVSESEALDLDFEKTSVLDGDLNLKKRDQRATIVENARFFKEMLQNCMSLVFLFTIKLPLTTVYNLFSPIFIHLISDFSVNLIKSVKLKIAQEPDISVSRQDLLLDIQDYSKAFSKGVLESTSLEMKNLKDPVIQSEINQALTVASKSLTSGVLQESSTHLPSRSTFILGSVLFVAAPVLIYIVARITWLQFFNADYE